MENWHISDLKFIANAYTSGPTYVYTASKQPLFWTNICLQFVRDIGYLTWKEPIWSFIFCVFWQYGRSVFVCIICNLRIMYKYVNVQWEMKIVFNGYIFMSEIIKFILICTCNEVAFF